MAAAQAGAAEARKVVTIVFADLIGSTALHERLDAESARRLMDRYHRAMGAAVEAQGGTVMQLLGDGVLAGFGVPRVAEDDAIRAVRAAVGMQQAFRELAAEQAGLAGAGLRVAVNTGEVVAGDDHTHVMGDPVNVAARLQQEAGDGDVLLGESTQRLVADKVTLAPFGSFALKGRAEPVAAYRVLSLERPAGAPAIAFVGRDDELRRIRAVYDTAVATPAARLAVILGSPGLGKSRLIDEFARRLGAGATVLMAHCDAAGGATFAPLAEALRGLLRIDDGTSGDALRAAILSALPDGEPERARIADGIAALVAGTPASPEEIFFVVRRGLAALASVRPVVLAIDDIQWAEPLLHDLIEHLVQWGSDVPLLVLAAARPELRDTRSSLATPAGLVSEVVTLAGLDAGAAARLAANVIGAEALPAAIAGRVLATSEGNPLFVGELVRMLVHDGALKREGDLWTAGVAVADLEMPPTIHALLAARIERLRPEERTVLERAAVIGRHFSRASLAQLLPREISDLDARLESLRRSELVEPDTGWFLGEPVLRFHHVLIRDAAYRRLLKNTRAELHGRFADWLEARAGGAVEHDETLGWHLEQAHQHLRELGPIDAQGRTLGERAARHLAAAGRRALARDDLPPAASLLERALGRLDADDPARADLVLDWCEALLSAGDVAAAARAIDELGRFLGDSDRLRAWHTCFGGQLAVLRDPKALRASAEAVEAAAATLSSAGDAAGEAKAHSVHALVLAQLGKIGACEAALDKALAAARRAHDRRRANAVLAGAPVAALWGPSPVTRASGRCLDVVRVLRITQGAPAVEAVALRCQAVLETLRGRGEAARRMIASSRRMVEELGITQRVLEADLFAGLIELLEGDAAAAERCLRVAYDGLREQGLGIDAAQAAALLGRALLAQGRIAEAEAISIESESLAGDSFKAAIAWRGVRAEALAARGEHAAAIEFARAGVEIAAATDDLLDHADARQALAVALRAAGRSAEAGAEEKRAIELWEAKGATLLAERARRGATRSIESPRSPDPSAAPAQTALRRVRPNSATAAMARAAAAIVARDADAIAALFSNSIEHVDHPTGASYGREGFLASLRSLSKARDLIFRHEPLAVLGDSLALSRRFSSAAGVAGSTFDFGAYEREALNLFEIDEQTLVRRVEVFAPDRLGDAVARLYERYAELLPEGPERTRAAATARSVAVVLGPFDLDRYATAWAPDIAYVDHRLQGIGALSGATTALDWLRSLFEVAANVANRLDDVLALRPEAFFLRWTNHGNERASGGYYERPMLWLGLFGADGLLARSEWFDPDRETDALARFERFEYFDPDRDAEALARFDALAAGGEPKHPDTRRVRPNAASANLARADAAFAARDADALPSLLADRVEVVDHTTGATYDRSGLLATQRSLLSAGDPSYRHEPLATLGDSLALSRGSTSASGFQGARFDVGAYEREEIILLEADSQGRRLRTEIFASDHLGDAVVRLYECYAELLPEGPALVRAAATARSAKALLGPPDRWPFALDVEATDHRTVGWGSVHGDEAVVRVIRALIELSDHFSNRIDDVLGLRSDALLVRWTNRGMDRASGGAFERRLCQLWVFGADGLVTRWEQFDAERDAEALARFDELATAPEPARPIRRRVRSNAATANVARVDAAIAARDQDGLTTVFADGSEGLDHSTETTWDKQGMLATWRSLLRSREPTARHEPLATLGDSLALCRVSTSASGFAGRTFDVGAYEREEVVLIEVDAQGRRWWTEGFTADRLNDGIARLYERYAELLPEGSPRTRAAATSRSLAALLLVFGAPDPERLRTALAPDLVHEDRRKAGLGSTRGAEAFLRGFDALLQLSEDFTLRIDEILDLRPNAYLLRVMTSGTDRASGGTFERPFLLLLAFGPDGLVTRWEQLDDDRDAEALTRFDELTAEPPAPHAQIENAATRALDRIGKAWEARDWKRLTELVPAGFRHSDRKRATQLGDLDRSQHLEWIRPTFEMSSSRLVQVVLSTRGDRLALSRLRIEVADHNIGPSEIPSLAITEVDEHGERVATVRFDAEDLDAAYAELDARYGAGEAAPHARVWEGMREFSRAFANRDWDPIAKRCAPDIVVHDRRLLGWETLHGPAAYLEALHSLVELAPDTRLRLDHVEICAHGYLVVTVWEGTREGGAYETPSLMVAELDSIGRIQRFDQYDLERLEEARARYQEVRSDPLRIPPNAAMRAMDRWGECSETRNWEALADLLAPSFVFEDRRRGIRDSGGRDKIIASVRLATSSGGRVSRSVLATAGDRLELSRMHFFVFDGSALVAEVETLQISEVDAEGRVIETVVFDPDDRRTASAELLARDPQQDAVKRTMGDHDLSRLRAELPDDFLLNDHRRTGMGQLGKDGYIASLAALFEQTADTIIEPVYTIAADDCGDLVLARSFGTLAEGGAYESLMVRVAWLRDGRIAGLEFFEVEDLESARARFRDLRA